MLKAPRKVPDDWFFVRHGKRVYDRSRYQLDYRNPAVRDYADQVIDRLVRDYGVGIPPEKLATIFDGSSSTTSTSPDGRKGMGIGLSICKTIILAHGGEIKAINHTRGAEFYFTLPKEDK